MPKSATSEGTDENYKAVVGITSCSITNRTIARNAEGAAECTQELEKVITLGLPPQVMESMLKLRGEPLIAPNGYDNGRTLATAVTVNALNTPEGAKHADYCPDNMTCKPLPITMNDYYVMGGAIEPDAKRNNPRRAIPINTSAAAMFAAMDAVMNPDEYRADSEDGGKLSIAASVAKYLKTRSVEENRQIVELCMMNDAPNVDLNKCAGAGAFLGMTTMVEKNVVCDGSECKVNNLPIQKNAQVLAK